MPCRPDNPPGPFGIGIRMALGAQQRDIVTMVLREAGILLAMGMTVGLALALAAARTATSLLLA